MCFGSCKTTAVLSAGPKGFRSWLGQGTIQRFFRLILIYGVCTAAACPQQIDSAGPSVMRVVTALNHLTVLEFHAPVTMAAAGSSDFQIERQENKVFVKPMKPGVSTDLFVWTASTRFAYELETTSEVKNMNFAIDSSAPAPVSQPAVSATTDQLADMMLTRALLGAVGITSENARPPKNRVNVRVEQVFRTRSSVYLQYTIENNTGRNYQVRPPDALELRPDSSSISLRSLAHKQLDPRLADQLAGTQNVSLSIAHSESAAENLEPGQATQGVVAIRQDLRSPAVVQLVFEGSIKATIVL
jgi:Conjugal transfer protein